MTPKRIMLIAGEASGDMLAAELVQALRPAIIAKQTCYTADSQPLTAPLEPEFFGAGGPKLAAVGVELAFDLVEHAVVGIWDVLKNYGKFKRFFDQLFRLAKERQPAVIILVDYPGFNRRFAQAVKNYARSHHGPFHNWQPKIVHYISPQIWAWRESRIHQIARDVDLVLSIFPFEEAWYAARAPQLRVEYVGHPLIDRYAPFRPKVLVVDNEGTSNPQSAIRNPQSLPPLVVLLPGSREEELKRHLPVMLAAAKQLAAKQSVRFRLILPNEPRAEQKRSCVAELPQLQVQTTGLAESLAEASLALASSGTVTMECAYFGVPTVVMYKVVWHAYQIGKRIIHVPFIAMPNVLAGEAIYPELIQDAATPEKIAREALDLLNNTSRRATVKARLAKVIESLGPPGASERAAQAIVSLL